MGLALDFCPVTELPSLYTILARIMEPFCINVNRLVPGVISVLIVRNPVAR